MMVVMGDGLILAKTNRIISIPFHLIRSNRQYNSDTVHHTNQLSILAGCSSAAKRSDPELVTTVSEPRHGRINN
jgi:hypothetical protein